MDNQAGISPEIIYERLSDRKYEFHCPNCKSQKNPSFLQSLYNTRIISREEAKSWDGYIILEEEIEEKGKASAGQGDASTSVQSPVKRRTVSQSLPQSPESSAQKNSATLENAMFLFNPEDDGRCGEAKRI